MRHLLPVFCAVLFFTACDTERRELRHALRAAGDNRAQLESVLDHYSRRDADSLKLRAAKYLIRYMPLHRSYDAKIEQMYDRIDSMIPHYRNDDSLQRAVAKLYERYKPLLTKHLDVEVVTADFLIRNIEQAFDLWEQKPWARYLDFDEFCERLLPYKCIDQQPLTDWRTDLADFCKGRLGTYNSEVWRDNARVAAQEVNTALYELKKSYTVEPNPCPVFRATTVASLPKGTCNETCIAAAQVMRSKGIPVCIDFTPNWTARPKNHFWMSVLNRRHKNEQFSSFLSVMGDIYFIDRPLAKVFRMTYRPNAEVYAIMNRDGWMPKSLARIFVQDVTEVYTRADTVACELYDLPLLKGTVYLAVFDNQKWVPVCWGKRRRNKARFDRVGRNVLYMPVLYDENRAMHPAGDPFYLGPDGKMTFMEPDMQNRRTVRLTRKYGIYEEINEIRRSLTGSIVLAADNPRFRNARTVLEIPDSLVLAGTGTIGMSDSLRYWQIRANTWCDIAELQFYDGDRKLEGRIITDADEQYHARIRRINDDDALTHAPLQEPIIRIGFDFGRPVNVSKIIWFKRSDGNDVYPGFEYTLYFWNDRRWTALGRQRAGRQTWLDFHDVPDNALLMLVCNTTGVQNRPFVCRGENIVWM